MEDRPTTSVGLTEDWTNILSIEITLTNNGVLQIKDVEFVMFVNHIKEAGRGASFEKLIAGRYVPPTGILLVGEPVTTTFAVMMGPTALPFAVPPPDHVDDADLGLIATFRPSWAPFWKHTRAFRFKTVHTSNGIILQQVPAENIESLYDKEAFGH